jgi:F-type H+-transporting ATPase subunit gamma
MRNCRRGMTQTQFMQNQAQLLVPFSQRDFAVSEKTLSIRIKAVKNIGKITKAMKMVAASKMRGDLERLNNGK